MSGIISALRAGAAHLGVLERTELVSAARDCLDPQTNPLQQQGGKRDDGYCQLECKKWMNCGLDSSPCNEDPHSITIDHMKNGATITTFANHAQSQRLGANLEAWLTVAAQRRGNSSSLNFTHGAFMDPHAETWFDERCGSGGGNEPGSPKLRASLDNKEGSSPLLPPGMQPEADKLMFWKGDLPEDCAEEGADADCPRRHPHWSHVRQRVDRPLAAVFCPPRGDDFMVPFESQEVSAAEPVLELDEWVLPDELKMRCVTDEQLADCAFRNTTVWLGQTKQAYEYGGAADMAPDPCLCAHTCNARCVRAASGFTNCYAGPGVMSAWLVLRAAGLAK